MRIVFVTSWPPRHCGIATYSWDLIKAIRNLGHEVFVVTFADGGKKGADRVYPILNIGKGQKLKSAEWCEKLYEKVSRLKPDVVHIQHEYGLYQHKKDQSAKLLNTFYKWMVDAEFPVAVTYHSVYTVLDRSQSIYMDVALKLTGAGIVHEEYQKIYLPVNIGRLPDNVYVIPHGAKDLKAFKNAKRELGLEGKKVVGLIGWWEPNKGFERVVKIWSKIRKRAGKSAVLVVAGGARPGSTSGQMYKPKLLKNIEKSKDRPSIKVMEGAFTPEEYDKVLSSFDIMVLPYNRASQSGNLAHAFALGVPCIATAMEGLKAEIEESRAGMAVPMEDDMELERAIVELLKNDALRKRYAKNAVKYVTSKIKWSIVAKKHVSLYEKLIKKLGDELSENKKETL
ncbi:MAG: glycosyltransferase [Candidatus Diapherotrites archaeon]|nr:glycosyltransferase [Candidatus Diapherotrites archaeon]